MENKLSVCIDHINNIKPKPDIVLVTGDLTDNGSLQSVQHADELLRCLQCPYYIVPGNHDSRSSLWSVFGGSACPSRLEDYLCFVIDSHHIRLIGLDSTVTGIPGGEMCDMRINWLDDCLSVEKEQPTIIFMHHPPVKFGVRETDVDGFIGAGKFGEIIARYTNIESILCGHVHLPVHTRWHGTVISSSPGMGMQLGLDLTQEKQNEFFIDAPAYQLHNWSAQNHMITHTIYVRQNDDPYAFE